jgi:2-succinyl-6-hydroxy-2,4-cyclohexadiene-1-carboxylate synthase
VATVIALHGFTGGGGDFAPLAEVLREWRWVAPALPGHAPDLAAPGAPGDDCTLEASLRYLDTVIPAKPDLPTTLLGYSLGGRLALRYALTRPERISALVLIGASPGMADPGERAARRMDDEKLAEKIITKGLSAFLADWQSRPLIATQTRVPSAWRAAMQERRGRLRKEGLAASLRGFGQGVLEPALQQMNNLRMPVLLCAGAEDEQYIEATKAMHAHCPPSELYIVPAAGHLAHLENHDAFATALRAFLQKVK